MSKFESIDAKIARVLEGEDPNLVANDAEAPKMNPDVKQEVYEMVQDASQKIESACSKVEQYNEAEGDTAPQDAKEVGAKLKEMADGCKKVMEMCAPDHKEEADPAAPTTANVHVCKISGIENSEEFMSKLKDLIAEYNGVLVSSEIEKTEADDNADDAAGDEKKEGEDEGGASEQDDNVDPNKDAEKK